MAKNKRRRSRYRHRRPQRKDPSDLRRLNSTSEYTTRILTYIERILSRYDFDEEIMETVFAYLPRQAVMEVVSYLQVHSNIVARENIDFGDLSKHSSRISYNIEELAEGFDRKYYDISRDDFRKYLIDHLRRHRKAPSSLSFEKRLSELGRTLGLDDDDRELLAFTYIINDYADELEKLTADFSFQQYLDFVSIAVDRSPSRVRQRLGTGGRLYRSGMVETIHTTPRNFHDLNDAMRHYLAGVSDTPLSEKYLRKDVGTVLKRGDFHTAEEQTDTVLSLLSDEAPLQVLLHGKAGTGKTELARTLIREAGKCAHFLRFGEENDQGTGKVRERLLALRIAVSSLSPKRDVLVVDEADLILNTSYRTSFLGMADTDNSSNVDKGWVNSFIDECRMKIIWISNDISGIVPSTARRFTYSMIFEPLTKLGRLKVWRNCLRRYRMTRALSAATVNALAEDYAVNAGTIASAVRSLKLVAAPTARQRETKLREIVERYLELESGAPYTGKRSISGITQRYDRSVLHTDADLDLLTAQIKQTAEQMRRREITTEQGLNVLLYGVSGSGKTEFVKFAAKQAGLELTVKRYSDLVSPFVGTTERLIAQAFAEAERAGSVLFIDEADSFFVSRESAHRSWEVSQTNEMLTQMENQRGIFICCSNLHDKLDQAVMRRFDWKIKFMSLTPDSAVKLYRRYFGARGLTQQRIAKIRRLNGLTPGDMKAVRRRCDVGGVTTPHRSVIDQLATEISLRTRDKPSAGF